MRVLGVDPSSSAVGFCVVDDPSLVWGAYIWSDVFVPAHKDSYLGMAYELARLSRYASGIIKEHRVTAAIVGRGGATFNVNTVRKLAYFEAAVMQAFAYNDVKFEALTDTSARRKVLTPAGVGNGGTKKPEVIEIVRKQLGDQLLTEDECDAYVFASSWGKE